MKERDRPDLEPDEEAVRSAWIAGMRSELERRSGRETKYNSHPRWDGGYDAKTQKTYKKPVWVEVAATARHHGLHPVDLVRALFGHWQAEQLPVPYLLSKPENVERALREKTLRRYQVATAVKVEEAVFRSAVWSAKVTTPDPRQAEAFALNDMSRNLSPVFRYSLATLRGYPDIAARWFNAAAAQVQRDPGPYLEFWGHLLPADLLKEAAKAAAAA